MNTRIRYSKTDNTLRSVKDFQHPTNGGRFSISIDTTTLTFFVRDEMAEQTVKTGTGKSLSQVKIFAKRALQDLGIQFDSEVRRERTETTVV